MSVYLQTNSDGEKGPGYLNFGKREGIGAIAQYQLMLYAICKKFNVHFYNSGFKNIGHSTYNNHNINEWSETFTKFFNFSTNKKIKDVVLFDEIDKDCLSIIEEFRNSDKDILIDLNSEWVLNYGQTIINEIYERQYLKEIKNNLVFENCYFTQENLNIAFHIRTPNPEDIVFQECREYYEKNNKYDKLIKNLKNICSGEKVKLYVYSQGNEENFLEILKHNEGDFKIILQLNNEPISDIYHMSHADLLIMANSSYSWIAHLMNYNTTLVRDNFWHSTYPNTLKLDDNYVFDVRRLKIK